MKTIERIISRITLLAAAGVMLSLLYKADVNAATLSVFVEPVESGNVSVSVNGDESVAWDNIDVEAPVQLDATPSDGYGFSRWSINGTELENDDQYNSPSISFNMPDGEVTATAFFRQAPAPDPSPAAEQTTEPDPSTAAEQTTKPASEPPADLPKPEEPQKGEIAEIMEQTSDSVGNVASTVNQINLATDLAGFAVSTPKTDLIKDYQLKDDEDILVKVSNFDAKKSPDCKKAMDTFA